MRFCWKANPMLGLYFEIEGFVYWVIFEEGGWVAKREQYDPPYERLYIGRFDDAPQAQRAAENHANN